MPAGSQSLPAANTAPARSRSAHRTNLIFRSTVVRTTGMRHHPRAARCRADRRAVLRFSAVESESGRTAATIGHQRPTRSEPNRWTCSPSAASITARCGRTGCPVSVSARHLAGSEPAACLSLPGAKYPRPYTISVRPGAAGSSLLHGVSRL